MFLRRMYLHGGMLPDEAVAELWAVPGPKLPRYGEFEYHSNNYNNKQY